MVGIIIALILAALVLLIIFLPTVALCILGFVTLLILLVLFVPLGIDAAYFNGNTFLTAKVSFLSVKILPKKEDKANKSKKVKKPKEEKKQEPENGAVKKDKKKKLNFSADELLELLKKAMKGLGKFGKLTVHKFVLHYTAAGKDPYGTAMSYSYVNAAMSSLAPILSKVCKVRGELDVWTDIDFTSDKMDIEGELSVSLRVIQLVHVALVAGLGILGVLIKNKYRLAKEAKQERNADNSSNHSNNTKEKIESNFNTEERMDSNG